MKNKLLVGLLLIGSFVCMSYGGEGKNSNEIEISVTKLQDKIKGAWAAAVIGVTFGLPAEFEYNSTMIQDYEKLKWNASSLPIEYKERPGTYDDIYMDLSFMKVIEEEGVDAPAMSFAKSFANAEYKLWFANQSARYNILNGLKPPASGHWLNNPCADDIDFQIEADFAGIMNPGMVNSAVEICDKVGHIMNYGDGYYGGVFVAALYSLALVADSTDDIDDIVAKAISIIPSESTFARCINDVIAWHKENPKDWKATWFKVNLKWSEDIGSPLGVFRPFNIDAKINSAWVVMGLLYGNGDFTRTFEISTRCGDDADCNPATAGGVLASIVGFKAIPEFWTQGLDQVEDLNFMGTEYSLLDAYDLSYKHATEQIKRNGGSVKGDTITIKPQALKKIPLEISFEGHYPKEKLMPKMSDKEISFEFEGIGFALAAPPNLKVGNKHHVFKTEMYIDGALVEKVTLPTMANKRRFTPFWKYQLSKGKHKVLIKILNPVKHAKLQIKHAVIYDDKPFKVDL